MESIIKKVIAIAILMMIILAGFNMVNAASMPVSLTSNSKIVAGETVTIDIKVDNPVYGISTTLSYDTDVFEDATVSSTVANSADLSNNVIVIESGNVMPKGIIGTITLKVKKNISKTEGKVSLSDGKVTDETITSQNLTDASIVIKSDATNQNPNQNENDNPGTNNQGTDNPGTNNQGTDNPGTNNQGTNNSGTNNSTSKPSNNKDKTMANSKIPQTGEKVNIMLITLILLVFTIGIVSWIKYIKIKK